MFKWVGGKKRVAEKLRDYIPEDFDVYCEPFLGAGSMFLAIRPEKAILGDLNYDVVCAFRAVRDHTKNLLLGVDYLFSLYRKDKFYFDVIRKWEPDDPLMRAVRFLFLVNYSYNGLYRVNSKGQFNVPPGDKMNWIDLGPIAKMQKALRTCNVKIVHKSYDEFKIKKGYFFYLDPPFYGMYDMYTKERFDTIDHHNLKKFCDKIHASGAKFMQTNSNNSYIRKLYKSYHQKILKYQMSVSCQERKKKQMLIITNY